MVNLPVDFFFFCNITHGIYLLSIKKLQSMKQFATYNDHIHEVITSPDLLDASCMPTNCLEDLQEGSLFFNLTTKISPWRLLDSTEWGCMVGAFWQ